MNRKLATLFVILILNAGAYCQQENSEFLEWVEMPEYISEIKTVSKANDGGWVLGGFLSDPNSFLSPPVLLKISANGEKIWQHAPMVSDWEVGYTQEVTKTSDGNFIAAGWCMYGCDFGPAGIFVEKSTDNGESLWKKRIVSDQFSGNVVDVFELISDDIIVLAQQGLYKLSAKGDSILFLHIDYNSNEYIACGFADSMGIYFCRGNVVQSMDFEGNFLAEYLFPGNIKNISGYNNNNFLYSGTDIIKTDLNFQTIESIDLTEYESETTLNGFNDSLFLLVNENQIVKINLNNLSIETISYSKPEQFIVNDFDVSGSMILLAGSSVQGNNKAFAAKTWNFNGETDNYPVDIGITNITIKDAYAYKQPNYEYMYDLYWSAYATVKNFSDITVNSFSLTADLFGWYICGFNVYLNQFSQQNLNPGDSIVWFLGELSELGYFLPDQEEFTKTFKLHSNIPNEKFDKNNSNDAMEVTFNVSLVGINETEEEHITIYPVPANEKITIQAEEEIEMWQLYSLNGQCKLSGYPGLNLFSIEISKLSSGMYFLKLMDKKGSLVIKKISIK